MKVQISLYNFFNKLKISIYESITESRTESWKTQYEISVLYAIFRLLVLVCGYLGAMAQNIQISGVVKDVVGDPLIGVSVLVKGGTKGTSTDYNGFYTISAPADGTLVFSYGGYGYPRGENRRFRKN